MQEPLTKADREKQLSSRPQILDPTSRYPKPFNGQRSPSQKIGLQRMRISLSRSRIQLGIQTQILSSSQPMVRLDSVSTNLVSVFPHPVMILGLDPQLIYPYPTSSHLSLLQIDLHPSVVLLDPVYLSPDQGETQVQNSKVSKPNPRLVPLVIHPGKSQLLIKKTTTAEEPLLHPIRIQKPLLNQKISHQSTLTKDSRPSRKSSPLI